MILTVKNVLYSRLSTQAARWNAMMARQALRPYAVLISIIAALFIGFLQLTGWLLFAFTALAVYGMRYYHPANFQSWFSYITNFFFAFVFLSIIAWVARLASLYMTGHQFIGRAG